jgi:membrane protein implicated in regulation of membrane protease activity
MKRSNLTRAGMATLAVLMLTLIIIIFCAVLAAVMFALTSLGLDWVGIILIVLLFGVSLTALWRDAYNNFKQDSKTENEASQ